MLSLYMENYQLLLRKVNEDINMIKAESVLWKSSQSNEQATM